MAASEESGSDSASERRVDGVFRETLGLLHIALVAHYDIGELEARQIEGDLQVWFQRFCRRSPEVFPRDCRADLLLQCCRMARQRLEDELKSGSREETPALRRILARDPGQTADRLSRTLSLLD